MQGLRVLKKTQKHHLTFSLHSGYGESVSLLKNLVVFVPALNKYSAGKPCVCEIYRICKKKMRPGLFH